MTQSSPAPIATLGRSALFRQSGSESDGQAGDLFDHRTQLIIALAVFCLTMAAVAWFPDWFSSIPTANLRPR